MYQANPILNTWAKKSANWGMEMTLFSTLSKEKQVANSF